ncbi:unnamed protein product [Phytophthora fragariaefolia]|uniref:Unnamed protein product n=1 Tax=Phytophthora fragariaefolia TaxID=1490495 RepID=A0A9W6XUF8_9STRA|nr:unnamed protein product [Phytophthora fragariaefolia]
MMQVRQVGDLIGPVTLSPTSSNELVAVKALTNLLQDAGLVAGAFGAAKLFDLGLGAIRSASLNLFPKLKALVGESPSIIVSPKISSYKSAADPGSDGSEEPRRMSLGPSGAAMLADRLRSTRIQDRKTSRWNRRDHWTETQIYRVGSTTQTIWIFRNRISAVSDFKEFTGEELDEDCAWQWTGKFSQRFCEIKLLTPRRASRLQICYLDRRGTGTVSWHDLREISGPFTEVFPDPVL